MKASDVLSAEFPATGTHCHFCAGESSEYSDVSENEFDSKKSNVTDAKLEEESRLLVGMKDGKEIILGGTVEELVSNLTTTRLYSQMSQDARATSHRPRNRKSGFPSNV